VPIGKGGQDADKRGAGGVIFAKDNNAILNGFPGLGIFGAPGVCFPRGFYGERETIRAHAGEKLVSHRERMWVF